MQRLGAFSLGESRVFFMDALGGFFSMREQMAQEIGIEAESEMTQRAGFASAERFVAAGIDSGDLSSDERGFRNALSMLSLAGYGQFNVIEVRFDEHWAKVESENSLEGWMFHETGTRQSASCDFVRGMLAGIMFYLVQSSFASDETPYSYNELNVTEGEPSRGLDISCVESHCAAAGDDHCQFVIGPASVLTAEGLQPSSTAQSSVRETLLRLNRQLEQILDSSRKDSLTKLYNRTHFESALRQRIGHAKRRSDMVSLGVIDVDKFKSINDTQGHSVGDRVLRQIARCLEQQAREDDVVARIGGDEFVWLMPGTQADSAELVAQRLRKAVEALTPTIGFPISISVGVANYPNDASTPTELYERADIALYSAKRNGRDKVSKFAQHMLADAQAVADARKEDTKSALKPTEVAPKLKAAELKAAILAAQDETPIVDVAKTIRENTGKSASQKLRKVRY
jgi:diguanylate cyclase (GGDEF)-like protein